MLGAGTQPTLRGVFEDKERKEEDPGLEEEWEFFLPERAWPSSPRLGPPASPVPAVPRSRSGTARKSSWRLRKISCNFSKCSEEAAEVAMAQAALQQRPRRSWVRDPLLTRRPAT